MTPIPPFAGNISFNANHSPMGAFMSFTCGHFGTRGGFGLENGRPGDQDLFIGVKDGDRFSKAPLRVLPFYQGAAVDEAARYAVEQAAGGAKAPALLPYTAGQIRRHYGWGTDRWVTDGLTFAIYTRFGTIPDPAVHDAAAMREALLPAVVAELVVDNTAGKTTRCAVFALRAGRGTRLLDEGIAAAGRHRLGFAHGRRWGVLVECDAPGLFAIHRWNAEQGLGDANHVHLLGNTPGVAIEVPAGEVRRLRIVLGCHLEGVVTTRIEGRYLYTRYFAGLEDVLAYGMERFDAIVEDAQKHDRDLLASGLSADQQFIIAHATRSYYNSTQLLDVGGEPFWIVNEGEYCMMNTLDLSVDHVFWELKHNPWVVRNLLERFVRHYSYYDHVKVPTGGGAGEYELRPGGISFCHDMGVHNNFSPFGHSSYELTDLTGCFSHMTAEQLCNWTLMAACYDAAAGDEAWLRRQQPVIEACLTSFINRGGEAGFCQYDSDRCGSGSEITTYDSLDHSLAQTRANVYMATKTWACYLGLARMLERLGSPRVSEALAGAERVERAVIAAAGPDGVLPAVFEADNPGYRSRILPAIEGLIYPLMWGDERLKRPSAFIDVLRRHTVALLTDPERRNLFEDGGIRLSSTSNNSWMSKIALFLHVARRLFKLDEDPRIAELFTLADAAHVKWQVDTQGTDGSAYWACSDQIVSGVARASKYYPRIITTALWLEGK